MMQSSILFIILAYLGSGLFSTAALADGSRILILGDSLSAAYDIAIERSWPVLFHKKLKKLDPAIQVINASISGETTGGGLERLPGLLDKHHPDILVLELGGNDGLRGYNFSQTRQNLQTMIDMATQKEIRVLLIGLRLPPNLGAVYNQRFQKIFDQLEKSSSVAYLPRFLQGIAADKPEYMQQDGIHPTELAQPLLADKAYRAMQTSGFLKLSEEKS